MPRRLTVLVVEPDPERALQIASQLAQAADCDTMIIAEASSLARRIADHNPDIVLIDAGNPSRDVLEELALASGPLQRPVAMFVDGSDSALTRAAIESGVSAYVVDGLNPDRLRAVIDVAVAQFQAMQLIRRELDATRRALEERKVIERAKGILMKARGISEEAAYALLRKAAMDQKRRVAEVAQALVTSAALLS